MGLKRNLTPLDRLDLEPASLARLRAVWITSVEELAGALAADPGAVERSLQTTPERLDRLKRKIDDLIGTQLTSPSPEKDARSYRLGALDPALRKKGAS